MRLEAVYILKTLKMVRILKSDSVIYIKNKCTKDNSILDTYNQAYFDQKSLHM